MNIRKQKKLLRTLLLLITAALFSSLLIIPAAANNSYQQLLNRVYTMRTSYDPDNYTVFTANGNTVHAEGKYENMRLVKFNIIGCESNSQSFKRTNSSFSADFTAECGSSYTYLYLGFDNDTSYTYRIEYDNGWFFGDNGISDSYLSSIDRVITMPTEASALYLSATAEPAEIEYALGEIRRIAEEVTAYADSDYEKARLLCYWVADNLYYNFDARSTSVSLDTIALYNVLETRRTVCAGFANMYAALLEAVGIRAVNIKGCVTSDELGITYETLADGGENHEWCAFYYEAEQRWVLADACWNTYSSYSGGAYNKSTTTEKYFDITPLALSQNHRADKAEQRCYFDALTYGSTTTATTDTTSATTENSTVTTPQTTTENTSTANTTTSADNTEDAADDDNTVLYFIIAVLCFLVILAIFTLVFVLIKSRR